VPVNEYDAMMQDGPAPQAVGNEYDAMMQEQERGQRQALKQSVFVARKTTPERKARVLEISKERNLPADYVERHFDRLNAREPDVDALVEKQPGLSKFLENPDNAALALDDLDALGKIENGVRVLPRREAQGSPISALPSELKRATQTGFNDLSASIAHLAAAYGKTSPEQAAQTVADVNRRARELRAKAPDYAKEFNEILARETGDVARATQKFSEGWAAAKDGRILEALKGFGSGTGQTVAETLDLIGEIAVQPRGLGYAVAENFPSSLPALGGAAAGGSVLGVPGLVAGGFLGALPVEIGSWVNQAIEKRGYDITNPDEVLRAYSDPEVMTAIREEAERKGLTTSAVDALFGVFAGSKLFKGAGKGTIGKVVGGAKDVAVQSAGEAVSEGAGQLAATGEVDVASALQEGVISLGHSVGETAIGASARAAFHSSPAKAAEEVALRTRKALQAHHDAKALKDLGEAVSESKLKERMPGKLAELIEAATGGQEASAVYFQSDAWDEYWQSKGLSPVEAVKNVMGEEGARAYHEAKSTGAALKMPLGKYVAAIAPTEHFQGLLAVTQTREDGMTLKEAQEAIPALPATLEHLAREAQAQPEVKAASSEVLAGVQIEHRLRELGFREPEANAYAKALEARYRARGEILGEDPLALFEKDSITIQREGLNAPGVPAYDPMDSLLDRVRAGDLPSDRDARGASLIEFLREKGGIRPDSPGAADIASLEPDAERVAFRRNLLREGGLSADEAAAIAAESGYLALGDVQELIQAIDDELRGSPRFSEQNADQKLVEQIETLNRIRTQLGALGVDLSKTDNREAKRRLGENEGVRDDIFLQSARPAPAFYSQLQRLIEQKMGASATADQVRGMLREIKPEERKWSGIDEYLDGKEKVSKDELLAFLAGNQLEVKEVVKGGPGAADPVFATLSEEDVSVEEREDGFASFLGEDFVGLYSSEEEARLGALDLLDSVRETGPAKFEQYTLPGGENYREVLFTLPEKQLDLKRGELPDGYTLEENTEDDRNPFRWAVYNPEGRIAGLGNTPEEAALDFRRAEQGQARSAETFRSSHFDEPNVLAHVRLKDRETVDGKRVLFIEELQSDWHQEGRKKGYRGDADAELAQLKAELAQITDQVKESGKDASGATLDRATDILHRIQKIEGGSGVPDAPFRKTWHEFALKRVIRMAAEGGYDAVAWTTGEQQAERYDLSKRVDYLLYKKNPDGTFRVSAQAQSRGHMLGESLDASRLEEYVGKDVAERITAGEGERQVLSGYGTASEDVWLKLSGSDLKVGGEGMKGFYDKILPAFANKFGKKFGARAGEARIPVSRAGHNYIVQEADGVFLVVDSQDPDSYEDFDTREEAERVAKQLNADELVLNGTEPVHSLPITPALQDAAINEGFPLFQGERGSIKFTPEGAFITLGRKSDLSTLHHELGHLYLEQVRQDAAALQGRAYQLLTDAQKQFLEDERKILEFLGVESWDKIERKHHEEFARAYEAYLYEGKAPSSALREVFQAFKRWMIAIYQSVRNLDVELTPEIRGVFDRLLATEAEITAAQLEQNQVPWPGAPENVQAAEAEATRAAEEQLAARAAREIRKRKEADYEERREKVFEEIASEVYRRPVFVALANMQRGTQPDGSPLPEGVPQVKLSRKAIVQQFGEARLKKLPRPYVYTRSGGTHPDLAASIFGFTSGDELLHALETAGRPEDLIETLVEQRMRSQYGDMLLDGSISEEAMKAVHSDKRALLMRKRLEWLASEKLPAMKARLRGIFRGLPPDQAVREQAQQTISRKRVRDIQPITYQRAEAKAARKALDAYLKGDFETAYQEQMRELLNHELYRAAVAAQEETDSIVEYMKRFSKKSVREAIGKAGHDYLEQIDTILDRFDFRKSVSLKSLDKRKSLIDFVEEQRAIGLEPLIPPKVLNEAVRSHYKETSFEELREIRDSVKSIEKIAKLKNQLLADVKKRKLDEAVSEVVASIEANSKGKRPKQLETRLPGSDLPRFLAGFELSHRKFSSLARQFDGFKDGGAFWETLVQPMNEAGNREAVMLEEAGRELHRIFSAYTKREFLHRMYRKEHIPEIGASLTKMGQLVVALNWGNQDNRQKLMEGRGWSEEQVQAILDRLDARDWQVVQGVWDYIEGFWPQVSAMHQRVTGVAPEKVEPASFQTRFGIMKGGYFPLRYDDRQHARAFSNVAEEAAKRALRGATLRATTRHGHRKERVRGVKLPVRLDFGVIFEHVQEVVHDLTHYEFLVDSHRLLGDERVQEAVFDHYGDQVFRQLKDTIEDVAAGSVPAAKAWERAVNHLRVGSSISALAWNVVTSALQPLGLTQSMVRVGPKWVAKGIAQWLGDAARMENTVARIHEKSEFMRLRAKTQQREINEVRNQLTPRGVITGDVDNSFFYFIVKMQQVADVPTWLGAYEKAMAELPADAPMEVAELEKRAVALADQAVLDAQGGGQVKDLAQIQRGHPLMKLWTNFYNFWNTTFNLTAESIGRTNFRSPLSVGALGVDVALLLVVPGTLGFLMREALRGEELDEDELPERLVRESVSYALGMMVGFREFSGLAQGFHNYSGPAGIRFFKDTYNVVIQGAQALKEGETDEDFWRSLNSFGGSLFHYPAAQIERFVRGIIAVQEDEAGLGAVVVGPPRNR
jgi:hypothetical protein